MKKISRVFDIQKNSQIEKNFTRVPDTDMRACFNRSTWISAMNMQQLPLGMSPGETSAELKNSWITTMRAFAGATIA